MILIYKDSENGRVNLRKQVGTGRGYTTRTIYKITPHYQSGKDTAGKDTAAATSEPVMQLDIGWCSHQHCKQPSTTPGHQGLTENTRGENLSW